MSYNPLRYMWIAEFSDGTAIPQFDPVTGKENKAHPDWCPSKIDDEGYIIVNNKRMKYRDAYPIPKRYKNKRIIRIGWVPFSIAMAKQVYSTSGIIVVPTSNPSHFVEIEDGDEPIIYRTQIIRYMFRSKKIKGRETEYVIGTKKRGIVHIREDGRVVSEPNS